MDPITIAAIAGPILGALFGKKAASQPSSTSSGAGGDLSSLLNQIPELRQMLQLQTSQAQRNDPLHAALTQVGLNILPNYAFGALSGRPSVGQSPYANFADSLPASVTPHAIGPNNQMSGRTGMNLDARRMY